MSKQILRFQSEQEFQNFFAQIRSAELPGFQAVEGSGGDMGFDGIDDDTAYQSYYPEDKNRTDANYIAKINEDLAKVVKTNKELNLGLKNWTFIVPEDLRIKVVLHLRAKSKESGLKCTYWGATRLSELANKYPHIKKSFPTIFLADYEPKFDEIISKIEAISTTGRFEGIKIIPDDEFELTKASIIEEYHTKVRNVLVQHGGSSSVHEAADQIFKNEADKKIKELQAKKEKSDKAYQIALDELNESFDEKLEKLREDFNQKGMFNSGPRLAAEGKSEVQRKRAIGKLNLIFGKG